MLEIRNLSTGYAGLDAPILHGLDLGAEPGTFVCLLGRNGAGKSTLLRTVASLQPALGGEVSVDGALLTHLSASERARRIAVVLTERVQAPGMTVRKLVELGRQPFTGWLGRVAESDRQVAGEALASVGAAEFADRYVDSLSDGERQRVMIARAVAQSPRLLILDEVTAFLDLPGRVEVMALLRAHARASGAVVLLSSHDLDLSLQLADCIWLLDGSGGLVTGSAEQLMHSGAIGRAFDTERVQFSPSTGRFELADDDNATVHP